MVSLQHVSSAAESVSCMLLVCLIGAAWTWLRIDHASLWRSVTRLNADVLMPSLCFYTFVKAVTPELLREVLVVPCLAVGHILLGLMIGFVIGRVVLPTDQRDEYIMLLMLATSMGNGFAIPFPLVFSLCGTVPWLTEVSNCSEKALPILMIWGITMVIVLWSAGYFAVSRTMRLKNANLKPNVGKVDRGDHAQEQAPVGSKAVQIVDDRSADRSNCGVDSEQIHRSGALDAQAGDQVPCSGGCSPVEIEVQFEIPDVATLPDSNIAARGAKAIMTEASHGSMLKLEPSYPATVNCNCQHLLGPLEQIMNPVLIACILGIVVTLINPLRIWLNKSLFMEVLSYPSAANVPITLLSIGGQMTITHKGRNEAAGISAKTVNTIILCRLVVLNLIWTFTLVGGITLGFIPTHDRLLLVCVFIQGATPTAANVIVMCGALNAFPKELSRVIFVMQLLCIPVIAVSIVMYLELIEHV